MYAVIFKAEINTLDENYSKTAQRIRELAMRKFGCTEFVAVAEGNREIAISYWENQEQIKKWKHDAEHLVAQKLGHSTWYKSYKVEIVEVIREYTQNT